MNKELYTYKCPDCHKTFRTDNPEEKICVSCQKFRKPRGKHRKKKPTQKVLTFAEISHIADVYSKINHKYLHYGDVVKLVESNAEHCVCCGEIIPEGRQVCYKCEKAAIKGGD